MDVSIFSSFFLESCLVEDQASMGYTAYTVCTYLCEFQLKNPAFPPLEHLFLSLLETFIMLYHQCLTTVFILPMR